MVVRSKDSLGILALLFLFCVFLVWQRGALLWDTAVSPVSPLTAWGVCQQAHQTGRGLLLQGQAAEALPYLQTAVTCDSGRWALFDLGRAQYTLGQVEAAAQSWQLADAYGYAARLATEANSRDDVAAAQTAWQTAVQIDPHNGRAYVQWGSLVQESAPEQAKSLYEQAIAADPTYAPAYFALGNYYRRQAQAPELAQPFFEQARQLAPTQPEYLSTLAQNTAMLDPMQAITYWQAFAELSPDRQAGAYHNIGKLWLQMGELAQAHQFVSQAIKLRPENVQLWQTLAEIYEVAGCSAEAITVYDEIIRLKPGTRQADNAGRRITELGAMPAAVCPLNENP